MPPAKKVKVQIRKPRGPNSDTRRFNRSLAVCFQEGVPVEIMRDWLQAIMAGHGDPTMEQDDDGEWFVGTPESGAYASTLEDRKWAWTRLREGGWGMPAQTHIIDADVRQHLSVTPALDVGALKPSMMAALRDVVRGMLTPGVPEREPERASDAPAVDAEWTDAPATAEPAGEPQGSVVDVKEPADGATRAELGAQVELHAGDGASE